MKTLYLQHGGNHAGSMMTESVPFRRQADSCQPQVHFDGRWRTVHVLSDRSIGFINYIESSEMTYIKVTLDETFWEGVPR
jgi:hypothetical protein